MRRNRSSSPPPGGRGKGCACPLGERAAVFAHLVGGQRVHVSKSMLDEGLGEPVQPVEIVRMRNRHAGPSRIQPFQPSEDGIDVLGVFRDRISIVETHVAAAAVLERQSEVQADGLGVAEMQVAVGLGGKRVRILAGSGGASACADAGAGLPPQVREA